MRTFVVRIWHPADGEAPSGLRGTVHDVRTGEGRPFVSAEELLALLAGRIDEPAGTQEA